MSRPKNAAVARVGDTRVGAARVGGTRVAAASPATARVFSALGDRTRLRLVSRLSRDGPMSITNLAADFPVSRQAITKHLRTLEHAGVVSSASTGREVVWRLDEKPLVDARTHLETIAGQWDDTLARLKRLVED